MAVKVDMEQKLTDSMMEFVGHKESNFGMVEQLETLDEEAKKLLDKIILNKSNQVQKSD